jgi:hypothetical protein
MMPSLFRPFASSAIIMSFLVSGSLHVVFNLIIKTSKEEAKQIPMYSDFASFTCLLTRRVPACSLSHAGATRKEISLPGDGYSPNPAKRH